MNLEYVYILLSEIIYQKTHFFTIFKFFEIHLYISQSTKNTRHLFVTLYGVLTSVRVVAAVAASPLSVINIQS